MLRWAMPTPSMLVINDYDDQIPLARSIKGFTWGVSQRKKAKNAPPQAPNKNPPANSLHPSLVAKSIGTSGVVKVSVGLLTPTAP